MDTGDRWHETRLRVRYGEVDGMGVVYHSHYLVYFELGRTELMRSLGATYRRLEEQGSLLMVAEAGVRFLRPARYDDELTVRTRLASTRRVRLRFEYEVVRGETCVATGHTVLACTDRDGRLRRLPPGLAGQEARKSAPPADVQGSVS